jgi:16S rRNA (guanine527-N7)-methyltransferase
MSESELRDLLVLRARAAGLAIDDVLLERLQAYFRLLARWNPRINLTGFPLDQPTGGAIDRLLIEPLIIARSLPHPVSVWFDLGSGGGSPAIPIQLYRPAETLVLVESKGRKAAFLREVARVLSLKSVEVEVTRIESIVPRHPRAGAADLVTVRAVRPSDDILEAIRGLLRFGGQAAFIGSKFDESEARQGFRVVPITDPASSDSLLLLSKV